MRGRDTPRKNSPTFALQKECSFRLRPSNAELPRILGASPCRGIGAQSSQPIRNIILGQPWISREVSSSRNASRRSAAKASGQAMATISASRFICRYRFVPHLVAATYRMRAGRPASAPTCLRETRPRLGFVAGSRASAALADCWHFTSQPFLRIRMMLIVQSDPVHGINRAARWAQLLSLFRSFCHSRRRRGLTAFLRRSPPWHRSRHSACRDGR